MERVLSILNMVTEWKTSTHDVFFGFSIAPIYASLMFLSVQGGSYDLAMLLYNPWPEILKRRRRELKLTQAEIVAGMPAAKETNTYGCWERGESIPERRRFDGIAKGLDLEPLDLARRYAVAMYEHYFQEIKETGETYGERDAETLLGSLDIEELPTDLRYQLRCQRDTLRNQIEGTRKVSRALEQQVEFFVATVAELRKWLAKKLEGE